MCNEGSWSKPGAQVRFDSELMPQRACMQPPCLQHACRHPRRRRFHCIGVMCMHTYVGLGAEVGL
jgi:hypothetical protein